MDPVMVLEAALVAGAGAAVKEQSTAAVKAALSSGVASLRAVLARVFGPDPVAKAAVRELQEGPAEDAAAWRKQLRERLRALPDGDLRELLDAARDVLKVSDPEGSAAGRYAVTADEIGVFVGGDVSISADHRSVAGWNVTMNGPPAAGPSGPGPARS